MGLYPKIGRTDTDSRSEITFRASPSNPCPVCGTGSKGCSATADGLHLCRGDAQAGWKKIGDTDAAGFDHYRRTEEVYPSAHPPVAKPAKATTPPKNWAATAKKYADDLANRPEARAELAVKLRLPVAALAVLPIGVNGKSSDGWTFMFPECDGLGHVIGINRRSPNGSKKMMPGSKRGLTIPTNWREMPGAVFIVEGASDTLAMTHAGLCCVGRPSNSGGVDHLAELLRDLPDDIVVMGENDAKPDGSWPGRDGAESVARALAAKLRRVVKIAYPPDGSKDVRDWLTAEARGTTAWPGRGKELAEYLTANAEPALPPAEPVLSASCSAFQVGDRVTPDDRGNVGTVTAVGAKITVQFIGKDGAAEKQFPPERLKPLSATGEVSPNGGNPAKVPEYRPFPVNSLPRSLREFVEAVSRWSDADTVFAAMPALTVAGAAIGMAACASPKRKYDEPPLLWACVVADSGTGKSPGLKPFAEVALRIDKRLRDAFTSEHAEYTKQAQAEGKVSASKDPAAPRRTYFYIADTTIERLAETLEDSPRGVVVICDELAAWFASFTRYKSDGSDLPHWLSIFDAGPIRLHRKGGNGGKRDVEADHGFAAICGGIQPGILRKALDNQAFNDSGLTARLVFAMPPKKCPGFTDDELDPDTEAKFAGVLDYLRTLPYDSKTGPSRVQLDKAAKERFRTLSKEFASTAESIDGGPMSAALPKASRLALRLALIWHCVEYATDQRDPTKETIGDAAMLAGETLARWFIGEAERVYAMLSEKPEDRSARLLAEWVNRKGGRATPRDLQRSNGPKYKTAQEAEAALDALVQTGIGRWKEPHAETSGRPTSRVFILNSIPPSDTRQNPTEGGDAIAVGNRHQPDSNSTATHATLEISGRNGALSDFVACRTDTPTLEVTPNPTPTGPFVGCHP